MKTRKKSALWALTILTILAAVPPAASLGPASRILSPVPPPVAWAQEEPEPAHPGPTLAITHTVVITPTMVGYAYWADFGPEWGVRNYVRWGENLISGEMRDNFRLYRGLLQFDLAAVPGWAKVVDVSVVLHPVMRMPDWYTHDPSGVTTVVLLEEDGRDWQWVHDFWTFYHMPVEALLGPPVDFSTWSWEDMRTNWEDQVFSLEQADLGLIERRVQSPDRQASFRIDLVVPNGEGMIAGWSSGHTDCFNCSRNTRWPELRVTWAGVPPLALWPLRRPGQEPVRTRACGGGQPEPAGQLQYLWVLDESAQDCPGWLHVLGEDNEEFYILAGDIVGPADPPPLPPTKFPDDPFRIYLPLVSGSGGIGVASAPPQEQVFGNAIWALEATSPADPAQVPLPPIFLERVVQILLGLAAYGGYAYMQAEDQQGELQTVAIKLPVEFSPADPRGNVRSWVVGAAGPVEGIFGPQAAAQLMEFQQALGEVPSPQDWETAWSPASLSLYANDRELVLWVQHQLWLDAGSPSDWGVSTRDIAVAVASLVSWDEVEVDPLESRYRRNQGKRPKNGPLPWDWEGLGAKPKIGEAPNWHADKHSAVAAIDTAPNDEWRMSVLTDPDEAWINIHTSQMALFKMVTGEVTYKGQKIRGRFLAVSWGWANRHRLGGYGRLEFLETTTYAPMQGPWLFDELVKLASGIPVPYRMADVWKYVVQKSAGLAWRLWPSPPAYFQEFDRGF